MIGFPIFLGEDIILDEEAFQAASDDFAALSGRLQRLDEEIEDMLVTLQSGFDTPAGRKFVEGCRKNLRQPMNDQKAVIEHISQTLAEVQRMYTKVFGEYEEMNAAIRAYQHKN